MVERIINIFEKYDTDKNSKGHDYAPYYAKHFPENPLKILEIGVLKGESVKMWHEIYPDAHIFGLDLFQENPEPFQEHWVTWIKGSQVDHSLLSTVKLFGQFDIIIDDGSHISEHQLMTFFSLIGHCKLYVVEDLHCCRNEFWRQSSYKNTMLAMMEEGRFPYNFNLYIDKIAFIYAY